MILLKSVTIKDFLSHQSTEISFKENDKLLLSGKSGSGKTTICEAILFALYGKGRSDNRSLIRKGQKNASVCLKLIDGDKEIIITRTVTNTGKNNLNITQNTGTRGQFMAIERTGLKDLQNWIETVFLKASYELFTNSIVYTQDGEESFVKASASKRKDLLLEIIGAGSFDDLYEKTRKAITANELDGAVNLSKIENLESTIKSSEEIAKKHDFYKQSNETISKELETKKIQEKELESQLNNISQIAGQITDKKRMESMLANSITEIDFQLKKIQESVEEHKKIDITKIKADILEIDNLTKEVEKIEKELQDNAVTQQAINAHLSNKPGVFDYTEEIETINKRLIPLIKETGKCPAGDACPFVKPIQGQIDFLTEQITEKTTKSIAEQDALKKWEKELLLIPPVKDTTELYSKLKEIRDRIEVLSMSKNVLVEYEKFESGLEDLNTKENTLKKEKENKIIERDSISTQIKELEKTFVNFDSNKINGELSNVRITLQLLQKDKEEAALNMQMATNAQLAIEEASNALLLLQKGIKKGIEEKECLELLKEALGSKGIKAVVIDYLIPQLEERINNILGQMSDFRIRLDTQKSRADDDGVKEGLWITIKNDQGEEMAFENYSGGERIKITIAISEALASLMSSIGFRLMDENIISLDSESTQSFVEVLLKLQEKFPQLLIISHLQEIKDLFSKQIMITKINGISKII